MTLDGSASTDPNPLDTLSYTWTGPFPEGGGAVTGATPVVTLALGGPHALTLTVADPWGEIDSDTVTITVQDTTSPLLTLATMSIDVDPATPTGAPVDVLAVAGAIATDVVDPIPVLAQDGPAEFPTGTTTQVTITATDASGNATSQLFTVTVRTPEEAVEGIEDALQAVIDAYPGTPLADKLEDVLGKVQDALASIAATPPDNQAALGNLEGAIGDVESAVNEGLDPAQAASFMDQVANIARVVAEGAIVGAITQGGHPDKISDAQQALAEGDTLRAAQAFKDAVAKYKDALAIAEGA